MQKDKHPEYQEVVYEDTSTGERWICGSAIKTEKTIEHNGKTYPFVPVEISAHSHPFYTGKGGHVDSEGRVSRFQKRYGKK